MLGYDARNRAVFQSYATRPCLGGPIERAGGAASGEASRSEGIVHGCLTALITQRSGRVVTIGACVDKNRLASDRQPNGQRVGMAVGRNRKIANRSMIEGQNRRSLTFAPDHRITSRRERAQP